MYELWVSRWEIFVADLRFFVFYVLPLIAVPVVAAYVISRIYGKGWFTRRSVPILIGVLIFSFFVVIADSLVAPERVGFAVGGGRLVVDIGWWGVPSGKVYNLSQCMLDWVNASTVRIWRIGRGGPFITVGKITLMPLGVSGYGMVVHDSQWILVARCPDMTYILGGPGLSPEAVYD